MWKNKAIIKEMIKESERIEYYSQHSIKYTSDLLVIMNRAITEASKQLQY